MGNITLATASVPAGTCPPWIIALWPELVSLISGNLNGALNIFNFGNATPAPADQDKPWYRLNSNGTPDKWYEYSGGVWISPHPDFVGKVVMWEGDIATIATLDGGEAAAITDRTGPMWEQVTQLAAKFPIGVGTLPSGTVLAVGSTGGEEKHTLTIAEMPEHAHTLRCDSKNTVGTEVRRPRPDDTAGTDQDVSTTATGGGDPHSIMPPYYALHAIRRTGRLFYRL